MEAELVNELARKTGADPKHAQAALVIAGEDPQEAERLLSKDICAIKGTYCASTNKIYGGFIALLDTSSRSLIRSRIIASYDTAVGNIPLTYSWNDMEQEVFKAEMRHNFIPPMTSDLKGEFIASIEDNLNAYLSCALGADSSGLGDLIRKIVKETLGDQDVQVTASVETLSRAEMKLIDKEVDMTDLDGVADAGAAPAAGAAGAEGGEAGAEGDAQKRQVTLKTDIILSPVTGVAANMLNPGDYIMVKIVDNRPQATYIANLLHGIENGRPVAIKAPIKKIERSGSDRLLITTEFGPGVFGRTVLTAGVKIQCQPVSADMQKSDKPPMDRGPIFLLVGAGLLVIALGILAVFLLFGLV